MVRYYKKKYKRQQWNENNMKAAISVVMRGDMGTSRASKLYQVPRTTLNRNCHLERQNPGGFKKFNLSLAKQVLTPQQENELIAYIEDFDNRLFQITRDEIRKMAYEFTETRLIHNPFNKQEKKAGTDWLHNFLKRHPEIHMQSSLEQSTKPEIVNYKRVSASAYLEYLNNIIMDQHLTAERIYNADDIEIIIDVKGKCKMIFEKKKHFLQNEAVSVMLCCSADGIYIPPMLVYQRSRLLADFQIGLSPESWANVNPDGGISKKIFIDWLEKFVTFTGACQEMPVLLFLNDKSSFIKSLKCIDVANKHGVILLALPLYGSQCLPPVSSTFSRLLQEFYDQELIKFLRLNNLKTLQIRHISQIFGPAFLQAASTVEATNGFNKSGVWPLNLELFRNGDIDTEEHSGIPDQQNESFDFSLIKKEHSYNENLKNIEDRSDCNSSIDLEDLISMKNQNILKTLDPSVLKKVVQKSMKKFTQPKSELCKQTNILDYKNLRFKEKVYKQQNFVLTNEDEEGLIEYIQSISNLRGRINKEDIQESVLKFIIANELEYPASWVSIDTVDSRWVDYFIQKHKDKIDIIPNHIAFNFLNNQNGPRDTLEISNSNTNIAINIVQPLESFTYTDSQRSE